MKLRPENEMLALCIFALLFIIVCACLSGCTTTKTVYVPSGCPAVTIPPEPRYPVQDLKPGADPAMVNKAVWATLMMKNDYIYKQMWPRLKVYEKK